MRVSDSNEIQFWLRGQTPYNEEVIPYIQKKPFYQIKKSSDPLRVDGLFDGLAAPTWDVAETYVIGDIVFSTLTGLRYRSLTDGNIGNPPLALTGPDWELADYPDTVVWNGATTYQTGDLALSNFGGPVFVLQSLIDGNVGNNPAGIGAIGTTWGIVITSPEQYKLQGYTAPGTFIEEFDFENFRAFGMNQAASVDLASSSLTNKLVRFFIVPTTVAASFKDYPNWTMDSGAWTDTTNRFRKVGLSSGSSPIIQYQPMYITQGKRVTIRFHFNVSNYVSGAVSVIIYAIGSDGLTQVSDTAIFGVSSDFDTDVERTLTLTDDSASLWMQAIAPAGGGDLTITNLVGASLGVADDWLAQSDCVSIQDNFPSSVVVEYSNRTDFDDMGRLGAAILSSIRVDGIAWIRDLTTTSEDHPQSTGEILPLRSESVKKLKFEMGPAPDYMHDKMVKIFQHAFIRINGVRYIKRDEYQRTRIDRSTVYFALCWLTDRDSLLVNIGGDLSINGRVFSDEFSDVFS